MRFRKILALRGPNYWANFPVLEAWVDLEDLKDSPSDEIPGFNDRLKSWLPSMIDHQCSVGRRGGFFERCGEGLIRPTSWSTSRSTQCLVGTEVGFGRARETSEDGVYKVAIEYEEEELGRARLERGLELCLAAVHDRPFDVDAEVEALKALHRRVRLRRDRRRSRGRSTAKDPEPPAERRRLDPTRPGGQATPGHRLDDRPHGAIAESVAATRNSRDRCSGRSACPSRQTTPIASHQLLVVDGRVVAANGARPGALRRHGSSPSGSRCFAVDAARVVGLDVAGVDSWPRTSVGPSAHNKGGLCGPCLAGPRDPPGFFGGAAPAGWRAIVDSLFIARRQRPDSLDRGDGRQRQDDHDPAHRPYSGRDGIAGRDDLHRGDLRRRPPDRVRRLQRP